MKLQEDYCSFELSKLLKEKGFNAMCEHYFSEKLDGSISCHTAVGHWNAIMNFIARPSLSLAMKWLREKWIFIEISFSVTINGEPCYNFGILSRSAQWVYRHKQSFSTYEEAVEAALKYSLENLF